MQVRISHNDRLSCVGVFIAVQLPLTLSHSTDKFILCGGQSKRAIASLPPSPMHDRHVLWVFFIPDRPYCWQGFLHKVPSWDPRLSPEKLGFCRSQLQRRSVL